jgi:outer membrane usher protein
MASRRKNQSWRAGGEYCGSLKSWRNEENVKDNLVQSSLRLNISVPQIYEDQREKLLWPEFWDQVLPLNLGWMAERRNNIPLR